MTNSTQNFCPDKARLVISISMQFETSAQPDRGAMSPFPLLDLKYPDLPVQKWYEYGFKEGIPRLLDLWDGVGIKVTSHMVGQAVERQPELAKEIVDRGHEAAGHGQTWEPQYSMTPDQERAGYQASIDIIQRVTGTRPIGFNAFWLRGTPNTLGILQDLGFIYYIDDISRDEPFTVTVKGKPFAYRVDVRLVAVTNPDLAGMVERNEFRGDLYYRLNVFPIHVPPLRERTEDIPLLVRHFVQQFARRMNRTIKAIPSETMQALTRYSWPGNIREPQNLIERALILSPGPVLQVPIRDLNVRTIPAQDGGKHETLQQADRAHILATLKETKWVLSGPRGAATRLGMNRSTLQFRMKKFGIVRPWTL